MYGVGFRVSRAGYTLRASNSHNVCSWYQCASPFSLVNGMNGNNRTKVTLPTTTDQSCTSPQDPPPTPYEVAIQHKDAEITDFCWAPGRWCVGWKVPGPKPSQLEFRV